MSRRRARSRATRDAAPVRRRYDLRWPSFVYIATTLFLAIGAINSQNNLLYWAFGAAVCGVVISGLISGGTLLALRVTRDPPPTPHAGDAFTLGYRVRNTHRFLPVFAVLIEEIGPDAGSPAMPSGIEARPALVTHCSPRGGAHAHASCTAVKRGAVSLGCLRVTSSFPFGLVRKTVIFDQPATMLVVPAVLPVRPLDRAARTGSDRVSVDSAARAGAGEEFYAIAEYSPGDPLASIAWKRSAALGTLVVRRTASAVPTRTWIEIDPEVGDASEADLDLVVTAAASIGAHLERQGESAGLYVPWADVCVTPGQGPRAIQNLFRTLAVFDPQTRRPRPFRGPLPHEQTVRIGLTTRPGEPVINARAPASWLAAGVELPEALRGSTTVTTPRAPVAREPEREAVA